MFSANTIVTMKNLSYLNKRGYDVTLVFPGRGNNKISESEILDFYEHFFQSFSNMALNLSKYAEFYGDQESLVQMSPNIAQISIFINFIKNRIFYIFLYKK